MKNNLQFCNVLSLEAGSKFLWHFNKKNDKVALASHQKLPHSEPLPLGQIGKDWRSLWQRKLNIAWLPPDQVFLKVMYLPAAEFGELVSMIEFQLEKISPLPVAQIVWTVELLNGQFDGLQPVIVVIVEREVVESFLGRLENEGFLPDRLELACLDPLQESSSNEDGVWIYVTGEPGKNTCLVAWWFGGKMQQLQLLHLPGTEACGKFLVEELTKSAWAGEFEGWFTSAPTWHLVADSTRSVLFEPALRQLAGDAMVVAEPVSQQAVAELSAQRAANGESHVNLLPPDFTSRYRQRFLDRLWMAGLGGVVAAYLIGVIIYFGAVQVLAFQKRGVDRQVAALTESYTNAVWLKARAEVLQDQLNLKHAALDSLKVSSDLLPPELTLNQFLFSKGQRLTLVGTAPQDQVSRLIDYNSDIRKALVNGEVLFSSVDQPNYSTRGREISWRFSCELERIELE